MSQLSLSTLLRSVSQINWNLKKKVSIWAVTLALVPVAIVGTVAYFSSHSTQRQITQARPFGNPAMVETALSLQRQRTTLVILTGIVAGFSSAIAAYGANRAVRSVQTAAKTSTRISNQLRRPDRQTPVRLDDHDELTLLKTNLQFIDLQLPQLLSQQEVANSPLQHFITLLGNLRTAHSEEEIFKGIIDEARALVKSERAVILCFDTSDVGTIVEESVASGWPELLWVTIQHPRYERSALEHYSHGSIHAIDDIYAAELDSSHLDLLEHFGVKAELSAPIFRANDQLFGFLIAHQCSGPHFWQQHEMDLWAQIALQIGYALDQVSVLEQVHQVNAISEQYQHGPLLIDQLQALLKQKDILDTTVEAVRKMLNSARVIIIRCDANRSATVVSESILSGLPESLGIELDRTIFADLDRSEPDQEWVKVVNDVYTAGAKEGALEILESFSVKAYVTVPILTYDHLFGLLVVQHCSGPREWQRTEIDLIAHLGRQVSYALEHADLATRLAAKNEQSQQLQVILHRILATLNPAKILKTTVEEVRKALNTDRVLIYRFNADWAGTVVAEAVLAGLPKALRIDIKDLCFAEGFADQYHWGQVKAIDDIDQADLSNCYRDQLNRFAVKASLVAPIFVEDDQLFGLLIVHHCQGQRQWQQTELDLLAQLAIQVGWALNHVTILSQAEQRYQAEKEALNHQRLLNETLQHQMAEYLRLYTASIQDLSGTVRNQRKGLDRGNSPIQAIADTALVSIPKPRQKSSQSSESNPAAQTGPQLMEQIAYTTKLPLTLTIL